MKVYTDTSGLFAALVANDRNYSRAAPVLKALLEGGHVMVMTGYVLQELLALLQSRVGLVAARRFEHEMRPLLEIVWIDEKLHELSFRRMELRAKRGLSLAECSSFVVMEQQGIEWAFAFDKHFRQEGFRLLTSPRQIR